MDRESILGMAAGRELDVLVAERTGFLLDASCWELGMCRIGDLAAESAAALAGQIPAYSTSIADAWEVVGVSCGGDAAVLRLTGRPGRWLAEFRLTHSGRVLASSPGETAAEAICKAALLTTLRREDGE